MGLKHGHVTVLERNKFDIKTEEGVNLKMKGAVKRKRKWLRLHKPLLRIQTLCYWIVESRL